MIRSSPPADFNHWLAGFFPRSLTEIVLTVAMYKGCAGRARGQAKHPGSNKQPHAAASPHAFRDEYTRTKEPARALAAETLTLERTLSDLVNQDYALTPAEITLVWQTATPRMPATTLAP
jgi:hypothetical protein